MWQKEKTRKPKPITSSSTQRPLQSQQEQRDILFWTWIYWFVYGNIVTIMCSLSINSEQFFAFASANWLCLCVRSMVGAAETEQLWQQQTMQDNSNRKLPYHRNRSINIQAGPPLNHGISLVWWESVHCDGVLEALAAGWRSFAVSLFLLLLRLFLLFAVFVFVV